MEPFRSVYIHIPFCRHRCGYCDFPLIAGRDDLIVSYLEALETELERVPKPIEIDTLFFGGGTPTHLAPRQLQRLFAIVRDRFRLARDAEWSVEANPLDLTSERVDLLAAAGVNRVSLGAQSFDETLLRTLERDHSAENIGTVVQRLRAAGIENVSLDLIFGVPGQTLDSWRETLGKALRLAPSHISTYGLTYEKGTRFWTRRAKGRLIPAEEELEREMYAATMDELPAAGLAHYEISNFARPGYACRHNLAYWSCEPCEAFGPGASRLIEGVRRINERSVPRWIKRLAAGESPVAEVDAIPPAARAREAIFVGLRKNAGIERSDFQQRTGFDLDQLAGSVVIEYRNCGLLADENGTIRLTREGRFLADEVAAAFLACENESRRPSPGGRDASGVGVAKQHEGAPSVSNFPETVATSFDSQQTNLSRRFVASDE